MSGIGGVRGFSKEVNTGARGRQLVDQLRSRKARGGGDAPAGGGGQTRRRRRRGRSILGNAVDSQLKGTFGG